MGLTPMSGELLHDLAGIGAQFELGQRQNATTTVAVVASLVNGINTASPCPYHSAILNMATNPPNNTATLQRYLSERPGEQHALFVRADNGMPSTSRGCCCVAN